MDPRQSQDEGNAFIAQVRANALRDDSPSLPKEAESYHFSRAGQISTEQMRVITTVNDLFARNLMHTLGAWLRTEFQVNALPSDQMNFEECVGHLVDPTYLCSIRLEPLGAIGLMEVDLRLASPIVDLLLGGTGRSEAPRALTDIEELILGSVVRLVVKELNTAWHPVGLQFTFEKRATSAQAARMLPAGERTLAVGFEVRMPEATGVLTLWLPAVVLSTILRRLVEERDRPRRRSEEVRRRVRELIGSASVGAVLRTPPVRLRACEIADLVPGMVLRLTVQKHIPAELRVGGLMLARARPVRVGEHRGARLEPAVPAGDSPTTE